MAPVMMVRALHACGRAREITSPEPSHHATGVPWDRVGGLGRVRSTCCTSRVRDERMARWRPGRAQGVGVAPLMMIRGGWGVQNDSNISMLKK